MAGPLSALATTNTLSDWLTLNHAPGVGAVTFHQLPRPGLPCAVVANTSTPAATLRPW
jgi:hypothetical protein